MYVNTGSFWTFNQLSNYYLNRQSKHNPASLTHNGFFELFAHIKMHLVSIE